eukprot:5092367-Prymnesium_polylepis.1
MESLTGRGPRFFHTVTAKCGMGVCFRSRAETPERRYEGIPVPLSPDIPLLAWPRPRVRVRRFDAGAAPSPPPYPS